MRKKAIWFVGFLLFGIGLFVYFLVNSGLNETWSVITSIKWWQFLLLLILSALNQCFYVLRWDIILHHHHLGKKIKFFRLYFHRMTGSAISYLTPSALLGGEPARIFFLKEEGVKTKEATSSVLLDKSIEVTGFMLFLLSGVVTVIYKGIFLGKTGLWLEVGTGAIVLFILYFYYSLLTRSGFFSTIFRVLRLNKIKKLQKWEEKMIKVEHQMADFYKGNLKKLFGLIVLSAGTYFFMVFEHYLVGSFLGVELTFTQSFLVATLPGFAYLIPIPGGFGAVEGGHVAVFALLGVGINAMALVLILRLRDLIFIIGGLIHASKEGIGMLKEAFKAKTQKE